MRVFYFVDKNFDSLDSIMGVTGRIYMIEVHLGPFIRNITNAKRCLMVSGALPPSDASSRLSISSWCT